MLRLPAWEHALVRCEADGWFPGGARIGREGGTAEEPQAVKLRRPAALVVRVREADGSAAAGVGVRVTFPPWFVIEDWVGPDHPASRGVTDAGGRCELAGLPAAADLFVTLSRGERVLEWTSMAETFQLAPGERRELSWTVEEGATVRGRVRDGDGRALAGLELALSELGVDPSAWWPASAFEQWMPADQVGYDRRAVARASTDAEGRFEFDSLRPGAWLLGTVAEEDDVPGVAWPFLVRAGDAPREVELLLERGLRIEGTVLGPDGEPVRGATVAVRRLDDAWYDTSADWTARDGTFSLGPLLQGRWSVDARASEEEPYFAPCETLSIEAGARGLILALRWGGRLAVVPAAEEGSAFDGEVRARLFLRGGAIALDDELAFYGLAPGAYDVVARTDDDRIGVARGVAVVERTTREVVVTVGAGVRVVLPPDSDAWLEWEGLDFGSPGPGIGVEQEMLLPPGTVTFRSYSYDAGGSRRVADEQTRTLAAGEEWRVEAPR